MVKKMTVFIILITTFFILTSCFNKEDNKETNTIQQLEYQTPKNFKHIDLMNIERLEFISISDDAFLYEYENTNGETGIQYIDQNGEIKLTLGNAYLGYHSIKLNDGVIFSFYQRSGWHLMYMELDGTIKWMKEYTYVHIVDYPNVKAYMYTQNSQETDILVVLDDNGNELFKVNNGESNFFSFAYVRKIDNGYLTLGANGIQLYDFSGNHVWTYHPDPTYVYEIIYPEFDENILVKLRYSYLEYFLVLSKDGEVLHKTDEIESSMFALNQDNDSNVYMMKQENNLNWIIKYNSHLEQIWELGPYEGFNGIDVYNNTLVFASTDHNSFYTIFKYDLNGNKIVEYTVNNNIGILRFNENIITFISNTIGGYSKVNVLNNDGELVYTSSPFFMDYENDEGDEAYFTYCYRLLDEIFYVKKIDFQGNTLWNKEMYATALISLEDGKTFLSDRRYAYIIDKDGVEIFKNKIIGIEIHKSNPITFTVYTIDDKNRIDEITIETDRYNLSSEEIYHH